ncbi:N-acetylmuramic acid 6-phosphate etherase [Superficieibacter sp. 1612_C1]|uniref:N-acetylmuramic acid 6-phosphate etherase n=1 Tax=Superficieibacter sp. 1612_C1 TaxID=2780382 RepID=UPI00188344CC|nr:N-acetylmuramic acid 6-phosphate etherase [Superficieibacter sp. 1612_C1]
MSSEHDRIPSFLRSAAAEPLDHLSTLDMVTVINGEDRRIAGAVAACLPEIARIVDNAADIIGRGGRVVLIGAGGSGRAAMEAVSEFSPDGDHGLRALVAGGEKTLLHMRNEAADDYDRGIRDLQSIAFDHNDMLLALSVSGKTPWVWGGLRHAGSQGSRIALITGNAASEAAQLAEMIVAPDTGPEVVAGFSTPKAQLAQQQILTMIVSGLAIRAGRTWRNMRVDVPFHSDRWCERQIAVVMAASDCSRSEAKAALQACHRHCPTAILTILTGMDPGEARRILKDNDDRLRFALQQTQSPLAGA